MSLFARVFCSGYVVFLIVSISGCGQSGPKLNPVQGKVTVGGKPAGYAIVFLHPKGGSKMDQQVPYGKAAEDGSFAISNGVEGVGAPEGDYLITVIWPDMSKPEDGNGARPDALNGTYEKVAQSKLEYSVKSGQNTIPTLDLTPAKGKAKPTVDQYGK